MTVLKGWIAIPVLLIAWFQPGLALILDQFRLYDWSSYVIASLAYMHVAYAAFLVAVVRWSQIRPEVALGRAPLRSNLAAVLGLGLFLYLASWGLLYAVYVPLSYAAEGYVSYWLEQLMTYPLLVFDDSLRLPVLPNILSFASLIVVGPFLEECLFRGYLLRSWTERWGLKFGILGSSLVFGIIHLDPVGAFLFGIGMCILYLRTQSLWVPILCHGIYNFCIWVHEVVAYRKYGIDYYVTDLQEFRSDWWIGAIALGAALVMAVAFVLWGSPRSTAYRLPDIR